MDSEAAEDVHMARARELAELGILLGADGDHQAARKAWLDALNYAEQHLPGSTIIPWIRSGLGDSLLRTGDYHGALEMAGSALEFCASVKAPAASPDFRTCGKRLGSRHIVVTLQSGGPETGHRLAGVSTRPCRRLAKPLDLSGIYTYIRVRSRRPI